MNNTTIPRHSTSFGIEACRLAMVLYILSIFRGVFFSGMLWGFWAITLIFWLAEKNSTYFRAQMAQLTVIMAAQSVLVWLLSLPTKISTMLWFTTELPSWIEYLAYMDVEDLLYLLTTLSTGVATTGVLATIFSALSTLVDIAALVLLIVGAVKAGKTTDWRIPVISDIAGWLDEKLHRGARSF